MNSIVKITIAGVIFLGQATPSQYEPVVRPVPNRTCLPAEYWLSYSQDRLTPDADGFTPDEYRWWREYYPVLQGGEEHIAYTWFVVKAKSMEEFERIDNPDYRHPMLEQLRERGIDLAVGSPLVDCYNEGMYWSYN